jgi:hypothetical protein
MKRYVVLPFLLTTALVLAACSAATPASDQTPVQPASAATEPASPSNDLARSDEQGAVTVNVTPLNLDNPSDQLEFGIALETHSVDLSMDLATLATLTTDTGVTVQATTWDAPRGGHHVEGKLIFPATKDGKTILDNATKLTLTITNVDAPSRVFEWPIP